MGHKDHQDGRLNPQRSGDTPMQQNTPSSRAHFPLNPDSLGFILLIGFVVAIQAICTMLMLPALPQIAQEFHTTPDLAQLTISGFLIGLASGQLVSGALSDRFGRRRVLLGGIALSVLAGVGCTMAQSIESLITLRALQGMGSAAGMVVGRAVIRDCFEGNRALKAMSMLSAIVSIVPMAGPPLTGLMLHWTSWRGVYAFITTFSLVIGVLVWLRIAESLARPDPRATDPRRMGENILTMLRRADCMSFVLIGSLMYGGLISVVSILGFVARDSFALDTGVTGALLGSMALSYSGGAIINNRLAGRWPMRRILRLSTTAAFLSGLATLAIALGIAHGLLSGLPALALLITAMMCFNLSFGVTNPTVMVMFLKPMAHMAGTASALAATVQTLGGALLVWLAGYLYDGTPAAIGYSLTLVSFLAFLIYRLSAARYMPD